VLIFVLNSYLSIILISGFFEIMNNSLDSNAMKSVCYLNIFSSNYNISANPKHDPIVKILNTPSRRMFNLFKISSLVEIFPVLTIYILLAAVLLLMTSSVSAYPCSFIILNNSIKQFMFNRDRNGIEFFILLNISFMTSIILSLLSPEINSKSVFKYAFLLLYISKSKIIQLLGFNFYFLRIYSHIFILSSTDFSKTSGSLGSYDIAARNNENIYTPINIQTIF